jgi:serine/threonine protein kinase
VDQGSAHSPNETSDSLPAGVVVAGRFTILGIAGRGGMGTVYRALDSQGTEPVAVKVLGPKAPPSLAARFLHEAQLLAELRHPGIVQYIAHGHMSDGNPYLAMAWLEGEDLAARLYRVGLTATESLQLLGGVATALAVAHRRGIVHRDLKPANLFLRGGNPANVAILDFGIAHRPQSPNLTALTQTGAVLGTPQYMSPEQARGERGVLPAADVFSLGAILFECLTGLPPFSGEQLAAVLAKILFTDPPPLRRLRPDLPAVLGDLLATMLHKDPAARPADADAVLARLHAIPGLADLPAPLPRRESGAERKLTHAEQH